MKPAPFAYARPKDWSEALKLLAAGARPGAGTQSLGPLLNLRLAQPDTIADLRHLPDYAGVATADGVVRIGAGTTHAAIEDGAVPGRLGEMIVAVTAGCARSQASAIPATLRPRSRAKSRSAATRARLPAVCMPR